ncbi:MAG: trypsin-like peptidase domain-containing protein [Patescibacteria group bacterium]
MTDAGWRKYFPFVLVAVVSSLVTASLFLFVEHLGPAPKPAAPPAAVRPAAQTRYEVGDNAFINARRRVEKAVVYIDVQTVTRAPLIPDDNDFFPFLSPFREFFGPQVRKGTGSGFIFRQDGYILTNAHVVDGAQKLQVTLADKRKFPGRILGMDRELDLAVVKIEADRLPVVTMGDSDRLEAGQWVLAIGNPLGYHYTVTAGIVSALNRSLDPDKKGYLIQTDAAINPGNSGGPLIDLAGNVVGINEAIRADAQGVGFAIPINMANKRLKELSSGRGGGEQAAGRPWMGITMGDLKNLSADVRREYNIQAGEGVFIAQVVADGPADKAGLAALDVIVSIDRRPVKDMESVQTLVRRAKVGQVLSVLVNRAGSFKVLRVKLEAMPARYIER